MNPIVTTALLEAQLKELALTNMARHLEQVLRQAREESVEYAQFLAELTDLELRIRGEHRQQRRVKEAHFPLIKPLEVFDFDAAPMLDRRLIRDLATGAYLEEHRNVILLGKSGTGKTHLATALGIEACRQGRRVRFVTGYALANDLIEARGEKALARVLGRYARLDLLILDELGYVPFSREGAELLFQILAERHERGSVIITTNLGGSNFDRQVDQVENETLAGSFNGYLQNSMIVAFNEVAHDNQSRNNVKSKLKAIITDSHIRINEKFLREFTIENFVNPIFFSNETIPLVVEQDDRRFNIVRTGGNLSKQPWFTDGEAFIAALAGEVPRFAQYLMNYPYDAVKARTPIDSEIKADLITAAMDRFEEFALHLKQADVEWFNENQSPDGPFPSRTHLSDDALKNAKIRKQLALEIFNTINPYAQTNMVVLAKKLKAYGIMSERGSNVSGGGRDQYFKW
jgi:DNA replication protein DnaC